MMTFFSRNLNKIMLATISLRIRAIPVSCLTLVPDVTRSTVQWARLPACWLQSRRKVLKNRREGGQSVKQGLLIEQVLLIIQAKLDTLLQSGSE